MEVLASVEAVLIRATSSEGLASTMLSNVALDTAVMGRQGGQRATQVEHCECPTGYRGLSCEVCYSQTKNAILKSK